MDSTLNNLTNNDKFRVFEEWALSPRGGFDNGNFNSELWSFGLEWGGSPKSLEYITSTRDDYNPEVDGTYRNAGEAIADKYNKRMAQVLASIYSWDPTHVKDFAERVRLWQPGGLGLKGNLFPLANSEMKAWSDIYKDFFENRNDYFKWCREKRFPWLKELVKAYWPRLIVASGITYSDEFVKALVVPEYVVQEKTIHRVPGTSQLVEYFVTEKDGVRQMICITYFVSFRKNTINNKEKAKATGEVIRNLANEHGIELKGAESAY